MDDLRVHELCFRGLSEFSLRMLSEGAFSRTRNSAESVLVTQLFKGIREMKADIDLVALKCLKEKSLPLPDKHKQASAFMQPLVDTLLQEVKSRVPAPASSSQVESEELIRAKAKLAQAGLALTPRKPIGDAEPSSPSGSPEKPGSSGALPVEGQRGKKRKAEPKDSSSQVRKLLTGRAINTLKDNRPKSASTEHVEAWMQEFKQQYKGKFRELNKHLSFVVKLLTENADKHEMLEAAITFGLDRKFATRLNISRSLAVSASALLFKYQAA